MQAVTDLKIQAEHIEASGNASQIDLKQAEDARHLTVTDREAAEYVDPSIEITPEDDRRLRRMVNKR